MKNFNFRALMFGAMTILLAAKIAVEVVPDLHRFATDQPWMFASYVAAFAISALVAAYTGVLNGMLVGIGSIIALGSLEIASRIVSLVSS